MRTAALGLGVEPVVVGAFRVFRIFLILGYRPPVQTAKQLATLDLRWSRDFPLRPGRKEGLRLATSVDAFNLFNRVNYTSFVGNLSSPFFGNPVAAAVGPRRPVIPLG